MQTTFNLYNYCFVSPPIYNLLLKPPQYYFYQYYNCNYYNSYLNNVHDNHSIIIINLKLFFLFNIQRFIIRYPSDDWLINVIFLPYNPTITNSTTTIILFPILETFYSFGENIYLCWWNLTKYFFVSLNSFKELYFKQHCKLVLT